ncbi:MAG: lytic transglycosylase domain-containing protein [Dorea sp.]|uniref:lytic transglycosylase domain-containing protein n=1 Tax=Sporofaciens musculi TaxID=2681861 RepID=UPI00216C4DEE|nr:lytic transglycosylase domain-containing protein [Sporofaciens musculi]MCI9423616.1 lytic transglycosylase domain-containing protein [Dorea sp.]
MGMDYTIYNNWYKYMSNVLNQIQGISDDPSYTYTGQTSSASQSFADIYNTMMRLSSVKNAGAVEDTSSIQTGSTSMDAIFEEAANLYDVPLNLLKAMGKAESGFDANAVSSAGAQGVMQLMPATARSLGVEDPFDARSNIMGGAKYISQQLKKYNGNIDLALAAYNAGSGNVAKYGGVPPFKETRNYIQRIKGYMNSNLTTGKTVEEKNVNTGAEKTYAYGTALRGEGAGAKNNASKSGTYSLSQENAQYFVEMMRLQMMNRASVITRSLSEMNGQSTFL